MAFMAGAYTVTYNGSSIGQIESGIRITWQDRKQLITGDNEGRTPQDAVFQGKECFVEFTLMEYDNAQALLAFWPYAAAFGDQGVIGRLDSSIVKQLIFTAVPGTPVATSQTGGPLTITMAYAVLAEDYPIRIPFASRLRDIPVRMRVYPSSSGVFFTRTLYTP